MLATLLLNDGRLTPSDRLIDALWAPPPRSARAQLHNMISNWRARLGPDVIVTRPLGYELHLGSHTLDLVEFRRLVARARLAAERGEHGPAVDGLVEAIGLWRGPALADAGDELVAGTRQALREERLAAVAARLDSEVVLGRYAAVLHALPGLMSENPYWERLYELQMLALAGSGRRVDALAVYRGMVRRFVDEVGVEPGPALRDLERRILLGEPLRSAIARSDGAHGRSTWVVRRRRMVG